MARPLKTEDISRISITTTREAEEPVAALLERLFAQPPSSWTNFERGTSIVTVYLRAEPAALLKREGAMRDGLREIAECGVELGRPEIVIERVPREDWSESWKKYFKSIEIGPALLIKPSWSKQKPKKSQAVVVLDPGLSFGTGQHATTSFCLTQIVAFRRPGTKQSLLDIGSGSGILAIAAAKLGYSPVAAFDFDPVAVRIAQANCRRNRVHDEISMTRKDLTRLPRESRTKYDVVCANLTSDLLLEQRDTILNRLKPGGALILAGILTTQFGAVRNAYQSVSFHLTATRVEREWQSGAFRRLGQWPA